jgi:hypothetical protein
VSNTHRLYQRGWHGLNIEPDPDQIPRFVELRPRDTTVNIGVAEERGQLLYTQFTEPLLNGFLDDKLVMCDWEMARVSVESAFRLLRPAKLSATFKRFRPKVIVIEIFGPADQSDWAAVEAPTKPILGWDIETIGRTREAEFCGLPGTPFSRAFGIAQYSLRRPSSGPASGAIGVASRVKSRFRLACDPERPPFEGASDRITAATDSHWPHRKMASSLPALAR